MNEFKNYKSKFIYIYNIFVNLEEMSKSNIFRQTQWFSAFCVTDVIVQLWLNYCLLLQANAFTQ